MRAKRNPVTRRSSLRAGLLGMTGFALKNGLCGSAAARDADQPAQADAVLFVNLAGGPAHLDTLDMKPDGPSETRGEFSAIQTSIPGLKVCEHLPEFAKVAHQFTLLRGISHTVGDHPQGQSYLSTGNRPTPALQYPSLGSVVSKEKPGDPDLPAYMAIPDTEWTAGFLGDAFAPFKTNAVPRPGQPFAVRGITRPAGLTVDKVARREALLSRLNESFRRMDTNSPLLDVLETFGQQAYSMIHSRRTLEAFQVSREPESIQKLFAADDFGQSMLLAVRLVEAGVRFITVTNTGWDTHTDNFHGHRKLIPPLDKAITAGVAALQMKGLLERTLVVIMGEFGRTPKINQNVGRDHYPRTNCCLMTGGGVQPGQLIGATDSAGETPTPDTDLHPDDIAASILHALGIDHHTEYFTRTNRPVSLVANGRIISELFVS